MEHIGVGWVELEEAGVEVKGAKEAGVEMAGVEETRVKDARVKGAEVEEVLERVDVKLVQLSVELLIET